MQEVAQHIKDATTAEIERASGHDWADLFAIVQDIQGLWPDVLSLATHLTQVCNWGLSEADIYQACARGFRSTEPVKRESAGSQAPEFPEHLLHPGGILEEWAEWSTNRGFRVQPLLALASATAAFGAVLGRKVQSVMGARTNVYIVGVAPTGAGKDSALKASQKILTMCGMGVGPDGILGPEDIASDSGLQAHMAAQPSTLIQIDEIGKILRSMAGDKAPAHVKGIATVLLRLYTSANGIYTGKAYADRSKVVTVDQPCLCLYGCTVARSLYEGLTTESLTDGMLARMMVLHGDYHPEERRPSLEPPSDMLLERIKQWRPYTGDMESVGSPDPMVIPRTDEAEAIFDEMRQHARNERQRWGDHPLGDLWTRTEQKADQLSVIHACSRHGRARPVVDAASARWACAFSTYATERMIFDCSEHLADNEVERNSKRMEQLIRKAGPGGMTLSKISRQTRGLTGIQRAEILRDLVQMRAISEIFVDTGGRCVTAYRHRDAR